MSNHPVRKQWIPAPYGFMDIYGITWSDEQVDRYNKISKEIWDRRVQNMNVPEQLLNDARIIFNEPFHNDFLMKRKRYIKVIFENGKSLETAINGSRGGIVDYYLNNEFNLSDPEGPEEPLTKGKEVVFL